MKCYFCCSWHLNIKELVCAYQILKGLLNGVIYTFFGSVKTETSIYMLWITLNDIPVSNIL